jgi:uncharacterized Zn-binding protein involved in type VI secretion
MPAICRGAGVDLDVVHCSAMARLGCSGDVFVNGTGISRQSDLNTSHLLPPVVCLPHQAAIVVGSVKTFINGLGCGRIGDATCTAVASGSADTFAG